MQNPLANFIGVFSLVRDVRGFQVNPLCRHDITRSDRQIGNTNSVFRANDEIARPQVLKNVCFSEKKLLNAILRAKLKNMKNASNEMKWFFCNAEDKFSLVLVFFAEKVILELNCTKSLL